MKTKYSIIVAGDALIDKQYIVEALPKPGGDERILNAKTSLGGAAANTAAALGELGTDVAFFGSIGDDGDGDRMCVHLQNSGVDMSLTVINGDTGYTVDLIDKNGERTMLSYRGASETALPITDEIEQKLKETDILLISGYLLTRPKQAKTMLSAAKIVKQHNGLVAYDPCPVIDKVPKETVKKVLAITDILLPNNRELEIINTFAETDMSNNVLSLPCVAVKLGRHGAILGIKKGFKPPGRKAYDKDLIIPVSAPKREAMDTTGAGDMFNAGFLFAMIIGDEPRKWLETANKLAAACVSKMGAVTDKHDIG